LVTLRWDTLIIVAGARDRSLAGALVVIAVAALAAALGSSILYALMRRGGGPLLDRYGPYVHLDPRRVVQLERQFQRHGAIARPARRGPGDRATLTDLDGDARRTGRAAGPADGTPAHRSWGHRP
jgi:hypothetical protein